jgi:hypothetical protein
MQLLLIVAAGLPSSAVWLPCLQHTTGQSAATVGNCTLIAAAVAAAAVKITGNTAGNSLAADVYNGAVQGKASAVRITCDNIQGLLWCDPVFCQRLQQAIQQLTQPRTHSHLVPEQHQHTQLQKRTYPNVTTACHQLAEGAP